MWKQSGQKGKWRRKCLYSDGWIDTWSVPNLALTIEFFFHPIPVPGPAPQADVATPDKEDDLLSPLRMSSLPERTGADSEMGSGSSVRSHAAPSEFDPESLEPDLCKVDLEVGPSALFLYGTLIRYVLVRFGRFYN